MQRVAACGRSLWGAAEGQARTWAWRGEAITLPHASQSRCRLLGEGGGTHHVAQAERRQRQNLCGRGGTSAGLWG